MEFKLNKEIAIHVTDLEKSKDFFTKVLGFVLLDQKEDYVVLNNGEFNFYLNKDKSIIPPILSFSVKDIEEAKSFLKESGCKVIKETGNSFYINDINGIIFDFIEDDKSE